MTPDFFAYRDLFDTPKGKTAPPVENSIHRGRDDEETRQEGLDIQQEIEKGGREHTKPTPYRQTCFSCHGSFWATSWFEPSGCPLCCWSRVD